eukprot:TRINITY_DN3491_c0_g1_i6.p2 TRINITY_DN3491_c0_g1~~TRINITY_DN3491_c0_g1_i6.p2  ORF type:complete len:109 (-),score=46.02 TRINITY_DN3491_c0_g1_i6:147-473(-)
MIFFFNDTATTEIYTEQIVGSVRCVQETDLIEDLFKETRDCITFLKNYRKVISERMLNLALSIWDVLNNDKLELSKKTYDIEFSSELSSSMRYDRSQRSLGRSFNINT